MTKQEQPTFAERLRDHAYRVAGGGPGESTYDPETLDIETLAADLIESLTRERDEARRDAKALLILEVRYPQRVAQARRVVDAALSSLTPGGEG